MDAADALLHAQQIHERVPGVEVLAVGRFVPVDQIALSKGLPWKISVVIDGKPQMIETRCQLDQLLKQRPDPVAPSGFLF